MAALSKSRAELVTRALGKLGVLQSGQSPEAEDVDIVDQTVDGTIADLATRSVYYVADTSEIDIAAFEWLADCLADNNAKDFGKGRDLNQRAIAETMLRSLSAAGPTFEVAQQDYF